MRYSGAPNELGEEVGSDKVANMVVLGAYIKARGTVSFETVGQCLLSC